MTKRIYELILVLFLAVIPIKSLAADLPQAGTQAPAFKLQSQDGKMTSLSDFNGKWVILYFYPKDFSHSCSIEAHVFESDLPKYEQKNAVVIGVSVDSVESHKEFCIKEALDFKLLADTDHVVSDAYGSTKNYLGIIVAARNTFLIDPKGVIRKVYTDVDVSNHSDNILADLAIYARR